MDPKVLRLFEMLFLFFFNMIIKKLLKKETYLDWIIVQFKFFYKIQYIIKWSYISFWYVNKNRVLKYFKQYHY